MEIKGIKRGSREETDGTDKKKQNNLHNFGASFWQEPHIIHSKFLNHYRNQRMSQ